MSTKLLRSTALLLALAAPAAANAAATFTIVNLDGPNEGFNDPNPAAPIGGNPGTTVGQQRLIAFQYAADVWGSVLSSDVEIRIQATFDPLTCTPTAATLGAAGTIQIFANFPNAELPNTWYHGALANRLAGADLAPGPTGTINDDIVTFFNSNLNGNPACLGGRGWYYGLDANHGTNIDLVTVLLHEFGHGLGFSQFASTLSGAQPLGLGDVYGEYLLDITAGLHWNEMTNAQRAASTLNSRRVVWDGINVTHDAPQVLTLGTPLLRVNDPASLGVFAVGTAAFGPALSSPGVTGDMVVGLDPADVAGPTTTDGCSPLTNAAAVAGRIAVMDRGTCGFAVKVKNAENAGAVGVVIANNVAGSPPPGMGGVDPTIVIPSVQVTLPDANTLKTAIAGGTVNATLGVDLSVRAGVEGTTGFVMINAPNPRVAGSSISHWDPIAFRNQLMEPAINADLTHSVNAPEDLTGAQMTDVGWFSDGDGVPDGADACIGSTPTVIVGDCDSGAENDVFADGCTVADQVNACADGAANHGAFVNCVAHVTNRLKKQGVISGADKDAIQACAAGG